MEFPEVLVIKVMTGCKGVGILADGEPGLGAGAFFEAIGGAGAAHFSGDPPGLDRIGQYVFPFPGYGESQDDIMQLGIGIGIVPGPGTFFPREIFQAFVALAVEARAEVNQPSWSCDEAGEDIGGQGIDGEYSRQSVRCGYTSWFAVTDTCIVNDGIEDTQCIDLFRDIAAACDGTEISGHGIVCTGHCGECLFCPLDVAGVQNHMVSIGHQQDGGHPSESICRACNEYFCHILIFWMIVGGVADGAIQIRGYSDSDIAKGKGRSLF